jgi:uncharacterized protein (DUF58 family)
LTLLLGFAAVNTGNNLLYLLVSALLGFMVVSGVLGQQNLQRLEVRFRPGYELYAATNSTLDIELLNRRRWLPAFLIRLEMADDAVLLPLLATGQKSQLRLTLSMPQRGLQPVPQIKLTSCFPINFFIRSRIIRSAQQLLVFPQPLICALPVGDGDSRQARRDELPLPGFDGEIRGIDDYRAGDPLKSIHWKLSARHAGYKSKRLTQLGAPSLQLDMQTLPGTLEEKLSRCAYLINHYSRQQRPVGLRLDQQLLPSAQGSAHRQKLLAALALYDQR